MNTDCRKLIADYLRMVADDRPLSDLLAAVEMIKATEGSELQACPWSEST